MADRGRIAAMYRITYVLGDLRRPAPGPRVGIEARAAGASSEDVLGMLLSTLVAVDQLYLHAHPELPSVYASGVRYVEEPQGYLKLGEENWQDIPTCLGLKKGGNRDLVAWRCAELRNQGLDARPLLYTQRTAGGMLRYRAVVLLPDGRVEDPSSGRGWRDVPKRHRVAFVVDLFNGPHERALSDDTLQVLLDSLTDVDSAYLAENPRAPLVYHAGVRYEEEPPGQEDWQDVATTVGMRGGDCVPLTAKVLRRGEGGRQESVSIGRVTPGDVIRGEGGGWTRVLSAWATGDKPILAFSLSNGETLRVSPEHRVILASGLERRAADLVRGAELRSVSEAHLSVDSVLEEGPEPCCDLTTDTGLFYLADSDVVVHNCEDLACWRVAELRTRFGIDARPTFTSQVRPDGSHLYHILVRLPDGRIEDPSRRLGMR
jgi:hypothetical protein